MQEKTINFLDLNIKFDPITCKLIFSMYIKPTNTFGYLRTSSNHPSFIYKNIPLSIMIRARRICSNYTDYLFFVRLFSFHLFNREYAMNQLISIAYSLGTHQYSIRFHRIYHRFGFIPSFPIRSSTGKCTRICNLWTIYNVEYIILDNQMLVPLMQNSNCHSKNAIYIIICTRYKVYYIGQTSATVETRIEQHLMSIRKFRTHLNFTSEIGQHLNLFGHNHDNDFRFCIFRHGIIDKDNRISIGTDLINSVHQILQKTNS